MGSVPAPDSAPPRLSSRGDGGTFTLAATEPRHHTRHPDTDADERQREETEEHRAWVIFRECLHKGYQHTHTHTHTEAAQWWCRPQCVGHALLMTPAQWTHSMQESSLAAMDNYHNECKSHKDTQTRNFFFFFFLKSPGAYSKEQQWLMSPLHQTCKVNSPSYWRFIPLCFIDGQRFEVAAADDYDDGKASRILYIHCAKSGISS